MEKWRNGMDALGNPLVLGALRMLDGATDALEGAVEEDQVVDALKGAHGMVMRAAQLLERAIEYGTAEKQP